MAKNPPKFDDTILRLIERGAVAPVKLAPLAYNDAISLRMKIYRHRTAIIEHHHPLEPFAKQISVKLTPIVNARFAIIVQPKLLGLEEAFANAGLLDSDEPPPLD